MRKSAGFAPQNRQKHPKMAPQIENTPFSALKHQFSGLKRLDQAK
jgi:hypothetical protein